MFKVKLKCVTLNIYSSVGYTKMNVLRKRNAQSRIYNKEYIFLFLYEFEFEWKLLCNGNSFCSFKMKRYLANSFDCCVYARWFALC